METGNARVAATSNNCDVVYCDGTGATVVWGPGAVERLGNAPHWPVGANDQHDIPDVKLQNLPMPQYLPESYRQG